MKRIAIVGSRGFLDIDAVNTFVDNLPPTVVVVSGGALGVDTAAEKRATLRGLYTDIFFADWDQHGKKAGYLRNWEMIKTVDAVVAFWDGKSKGTKHSIDIAKKNNKKTYVVYPDGIIKSHN